MKELRDRITILVCTCDSYSDLWYPFFKLLSIYWPDNNCKIILNTETKSFAYGDLDIQSFSLGSCEYGERMIKHIDKIQTPYTLLMLDDFFLRREVDVAKLQHIIDYMDREDDVVCFSCDKNEYVDNNCQVLNFSKIKKYAPFKLNMQAAIWKTGALKNYWAPKDNPWIWEVFVNFLTFDSKDIFYSSQRLEDAPLYYGFNPDGMGVFRGKWVIDDVKPLFDKHSIALDYTKRGVYVKEKSVNRLPILKTMPYVFKRIPFKYAFMFSIFEVYKRLCKRIKVGYKYQNYVEYLSKRCNN